jgi:hypothetical protein
MPASAGGIADKYNGYNETYNTKHRNGIDAKIPNFLGLIIIISK